MLIIVEHMLATSPPSMFQAIYRENKLLAVQFSSVQFLVSSTERPVPMLLNNLLTLL